MLPICHPWKEFGKWLSMVIYIIPFHSNFANAALILLSKSVLWTRWSISQKVTEIHNQKAPEPEHVSFLEPSVAKIWFWKRAPCNWFVVVCSRQVVDTSTRRLFSETLAANPPACHWTSLGYNKQSQLSPQFHSFSPLERSCFNIIEVSRGRRTVEIFRNSCSPRAKGWAGPGVTCFPGNSTPRSFTEETFETVWDQRVGPFMASQALLSKGTHYPWVPTRSTSRGMPQGCEKQPQPSTVTTKMFVVDGLQKNILHFPWTFVWPLIYLIHQVFIDIASYF